MYNVYASLISYQGTPYIPVFQFQGDCVVGVDAGDAHHQDGGEDEEDVKEGQA